MPSTAKASTITPLVDLMADSQPFGIGQERQVNGQCSNCGDIREKLYTCSGCGLETYCSTACQKSSWKHHKALCQLMQLRLQKVDDEEATKLKPLLFTWPNP